jgi:hypothetical protein
MNVPLRHKASRCQQPSSTHRQNPGLKARSADRFLPRHRYLEQLPRSSYLYWRFLSTSRPLPIVHSSIDSSLLSSLRKFSCIHRRPSLSIVVPEVKAQGHQVLPVPATYSVSTSIPTIHRASPLPFPFPVVYPTSNMNVRAPTSATAPECARSFHYFTSLHRIALLLVPRPVSCVLCLLSISRLFTLFHPVCTGAEGSVSMYT